MFGCPPCLVTLLYVWMPPYVWILPCMFGHTYVWMPPEYVWTPPYVWMLTCMFGHPHVCTPPICLDAPCMFGCLLYIYSTKKACFVRLRGYPYTPYIWMFHMFGCPYMFGHHPYGWMSFIPLDATMHLAAFKHTGGCPNIGGTQTYRGHPNIWGECKHEGCPNIQGVHLNIQGASECMGAYGHPLLLTKHAFFVLCMYRGHPNI